MHMQRDNTGLDGSAQDNGVELRDLLKPFDTMDGLGGFHIQEDTRLHTACTCSPLAVASLWTVPH